MIPLTDAILGWVVEMAGDLGIALIRTARDERRLRRHIEAELARVVAGVDPAVRANAERALIMSVRAPVRLRPAAGIPLSQALHDVVVSQLLVLDQWVDEGSGLAFAQATGIEPDELADRVADAVLSALRNYVAASGVRELVHGLDVAEVTTKLDAISFQIAGLTVNARAAATFTLPRDIATFTGRRDQLERLLEVGSAAVQAGGRAIDIHAIDGMAGIGKTALAVHAAHLLADRFPDGQVFLHLHGHTPGQRPVEPADALATLLLTCGIPPDQIPSELNARAARWRDWVGSKKLLLLLDDAVSTEQVRHLLPGSNQALVLITSRRRLTALNEVVSVSLDTLPEGEAAELFTRLASRPGLAPSDPSVATVVRLCGYLPLAIRLTAAQLAHHSSWTIDELVIDLASTRDRIAAMRAESDSVTSAFDLSYQDLSANQQLLFRRLGLHPGHDFDAYIGAALSGLDLLVTQRVLDELYIHHLIEEPGRGRYRMHDLIREQARSLAARDDERETATAIDQLLGYFLHTAVNAARHIASRIPLPPPPPLERPPAWVPEFPGAAQARAWLQAERANLSAAVESAVSRTVPLVAIHLPVAITQFLRGAGYWDQAVALNRQAADVARKVNDRAGEALALISRASVHRVAFENAEAISCAERAIALCRAIGDRLGEAAGLHELGVVERNANDYAAGQARQAAALEIYRELGSSLGEATTANELGVIQWLVGDLPTALRSQTRARDLSQETGNAYGLAIAYGELGLVNISIGSYPAAAVNVASSLNMHRESGNRHAEAISLKFLGETQYLTGDYAAAINTLREAVDLDVEVGNRYEMAFALRELGLVYLRTGDYTQARTLLVQAAATHREFNSRYGEGFALSSLGRAQSALGEFRDAADSLTAALRIHRELGHRLGIAYALLGLGDLALRRGDARAARPSYAEGLELARVGGAQLDQGQALTGLGDCAAATDEPEEAAVRWREALAIFQRIGAPDADAVGVRLRTSG
jgi:tetratricopeptide (TPR) repeat protein